MIFLAKNMKTKISVKNRTVSWIGKRPRLERALEGVGFVESESLVVTVFECCLDPGEYIGLDEWLETVVGVRAIVTLSLLLWFGKWKVEMGGVESSLESKNVHKAIDAAYKRWWKSGRLVNYKNEELTLEELVEKYG
jgi:hypothetical protein